MSPADQWPAITPMPPILDPERHEAQAAAAAADRPLAPSPEALVIAAGVAIAALAPQSEHLDAARAGLVQAAAALAEHRAAVAGAPAPTSAES